MTYFRSLFLVFLFGLLNWTTAAFASDVLVPIPRNHMATVCQFEEPQSTIPTFTEPQCKIQKLHELNPQNALLWVLIEFDRHEHWRHLEPPYGFYLFGKGSEQVYLNGTLLGDNGKPAVDESEVIGRMDSVFYVADSLVKDQGNQLIINVSGQHSIIDLDYPVHFMGFGQYGDTRRFVQRYSAWGLMLMGLFAVSCFYFFVLSRGQSPLREYRLFAILCLIAGLQLGAEISRGLINYHYPWQDIRLITVTALSFSFGILILIYSSFKVARGSASHWVYSGLIMTLLVIIFAEGFDTKTTAGVFVPLLVSLVQLFISWRKSKKPDTLRWFLVQLVVGITIVLSAASFHEMNHFIIIGGFIGYLFVQQAKEFRMQNEQLQIEQAHTAKLEFKLAQNVESHSTFKLEIVVGGKIEYVPANDIAYCKASGDYVELHLKDLGEKLYSGSLKQLEELLPPVFLKVHRSYLVNLNEVTALSSKNMDEVKGNALLLSNQQQVPVSRRLLASVRDSLKQASA